MNDQEILIKKLGLIKKGNNKSDNTQLNVKLLSKSIIEDDP